MVAVFMETQELEPPLTLVYSDLRLQLDGYSVEQAVEIEIPLLPPGGRGPAKGFGCRAAGGAGLNHARCIRMGGGKT
jgi:hypothetical protein